MKYDVEMGSSVMTDIQNFIKIGSGIQKLTRGERIHTYTYIDRMGIE
jgi:hypothetical protein